ncbi:Protein of unknown function [Quadrisphaera granulorum]|uniref:DUF2975 family protein n=1 Tax=Quadrisphaera granulorum TaxID=317664 RepID=A0A315ZP98_9ACTN|nr:DUF2975 domain-containing protein [Quadrisphaera granulorum]PWJ47465.1 Protein of unknown function (DUF2975) [Quadrisphaera granulorum]SZE98766.1 Protein of unknown function [Quadrisphaera granulorum]
MVLDDRADDVPAPLRPNRRRASALHVGATFMRLLVALGALLVAASIWTALTGRAILSDGGLASYLTLDLLPQLQQADPRGDATIRIIDLQLWVRLLAYTPNVITGLVMVFSALTTTKILIAIAAARPFEPSTARRVHRLGLLMAGGGALAGLTDTVASFTFSITQAGDYDSGWHTAYEGLSFTAGDWPWTLIITGTVVTAAAAAFREGARLQHEADGVV